MHSSHDSGPRFAIGVFLTLALALYVASYVILVHPDRDEYAAVQGTIIVIKSPDYLLGGEVAARVYWPLEQFDRRLRPIAWWKC